MDTLWLLVVLSVLFPLTHLVLSSGPVRKGLVRVIGEWPFRGLYSLIALACLAGMIIVYRHGRHLGVQLWDLPRPVELVLALPLMLAALVLVVTAFAAPSPAGMAPVAVRARGVLRITRHPLSIGLACFGLAHLLANGTVGDVAFFGSFVVVGVLGAYDMDALDARAFDPRRRALFEYWGHEASWLPIELYPVLGFRREEYRLHPWWGDVVAQHPEVAENLLCRIRNEGPLRSVDMEGRGSRGWWDLKVAKRVAAALWSSGELAIRERRAFQRSYDLTERVIPKQWRQITISREEALERLLPQEVLVRRGGEEHRVLADALVPGDVLLLREGDRVSADARVVGFPMPGGAIGPNVHMMKEAGILDRYSEVLAEFPVEVNSVVRRFFERQAGIVDDARGNSQGATP